MQLVIHVVQNRLNEEQKSHWEKTNKEIYLLKLCVFCLSCASATFALQRGGFVPREWLAAKGLFFQDTTRTFSGPCVKSFLQTS